MPRNRHKRTAMLTKERTYTNHKLGVLLLSGCINAIKSVCYGRIKGRMEHLLCIFSRSRAHIKS
jgi:hypothetical protein